MTFSFNLLQAMVVTHSERSVNSKQTDGQTDRNDCITYRATAVGKNYFTVNITIVIQISLLYSLTLLHTGTLTNARVDV